MLRNVDNIYNLSGTQTITKHSKEYLMKNFNPNLPMNKDQIDDDFYSDDCDMPQFKSSGHNETFNIDTNNVSIVF